MDLSRRYFPINGKGLSAIEKGKGGMQGALSVSTDNLLAELISHLICSARCGIPTMCKLHWWDWDLKDIIMAWRVLAFNNSVMDVSEDIKIFDSGHSVFSNTQWNIYSTNSSISVIFSHIIMRTDITSFLMMAAAIVLGATGAAWLSVGSIQTSIDSLVIKTEDKHYFLALIMAVIQKSR